jgi:hypothetical protein
MNPKLPTILPKLRPTQAERTAVQSEAASDMRGSYLTEAAQTADLLVQAVRAAHRAHCSDTTSAMELLLRDAMADAVRMLQRLQEIERCAQ